MGFPQLPGRTEQQMTASIQPLARAGARTERPLNTALAVYLHIPFCRTRCSYCAFNTYAGLSNLIPTYMGALRHEIGLASADSRRSVHTIYFGGGTPSLIAPSEIEAALDACADAFALAPNTEISLEANPGTVDQPYLEALRRSGVNRLSIGMQSANAPELRLFARRHTTDDTRATVRMARAAGFENISLDLIYGVPHQTFDDWRCSVDAALNMRPDHLSLYSLGIEDATPMRTWVERGTVPLPDPDLAADMYDWASDALAAAGFEQYEISNWARPGFACQHNLHVWRNLPYLGLGAGAHGCALRTRYVNTLRPPTYIERVTAQREPLPFPLTAAAEEIDIFGELDEMADTMILALRLTQEGVSYETFRERFGRDLRSVYGAELDRMIALGLLVNGADGAVRLTPRARLIGNLVFSEFV
jgi:oxygen-independent coproporphyrinogen-3 oxidase